ncbi:MAG: HAMP domain-containing protein [Anaerolineae bacterium]|nr:HAMP domain-containing protein [Anaerolineae bacterium]
MTLWKKTLTIVAIVMLGSGLLLYLAARYIVLGGYRRLENAYVQQNVQRAVSALDDELRKMNTTLGDWAIWDDTCTFVQTGDPEYIEANLNDVTLVNLEFNLMLFTDASDKVVFSTLVDLDTESAIPIPGTLQEHLTDVFFIEHAGLQESVTGIVILPEAALLLAAQPIVPTSGEGPRCGTMLMGRYLDPAMVSHLAETTHLALTFYQATDAQVAPSVQAALSRDPIFIHLLDGNTIAGYASIADIYGQPGLIVETTMVRDIYHQGRSSLLYFMLSTIMIGCIFGITTLVFLKRAILARVFTLIATVHEIGALSDPSRRIPLVGADELTELEKALNGMLEALEHAQTEQRRAEADLRTYSEGLEAMVAERTLQLQTQYARLDAILRSTTDGIVVASDEGTILQMNPVAQTWLTQTLTPEDTQRLREAIQQLVRQTPHQPAAVLELKGISLELNGARLTPPDATQSVVQLSSSADKFVPATVIAIHDVRHLKSLAQMQASFLSSVSHELRTPVATIKLYVDLLRRRPAEIERYLTALEEAAEQQTRLIESILSLSRIDAGQLELKRVQANLNTLVKQSLTATIVHIAEQQNIRLSYQFSGYNLCVLVDEERIERVIYELINNALHYTLPDGEVVVATGSKMREGRQWVYLTVIDTGIGISEAELPHIFKRFYRGKRAQQIRASGTGLGLALAEEIIALHGGEITVTSQEESGSTFVMWLPSDI